jgi:hypothetical protein
MLEHWRVKSCRHGFRNGLEPSSFGFSNIDYPHWSAAGAHRLLTRPANLDDSATVRAEMRNGIATVGLHGLGSHPWQLTWRDISPNVLVGGPASHLLGTLNFLNDLFR